MTRAAPCGVALLPPLVRNNGIITNSFQLLYEQRQPLDLNELQHALSSITERKKQITETYLQIIEDTADEFLRSVVGVNTKALSDRYLDEPPRNMQLLRHNCDLLVHTAQDAFNPNSEVNTQLLIPLVHRIYLEFLNPLRSELEAFWKKYGSRLHNSVEQQQQQEQQQNSSSSSTAGGGGRGGGGEQQYFSLSRLKTKCLGIYQDIEHIDTMRQLDSLSALEMTEKCKHGLSHVVPVSGLTLSRIHRHHNEHQSAIEHWSK